MPERYEGGVPLRKNTKKKKNVTKCGSVGILIGSAGILIGSFGILIGSVSILIHWYFKHWYFEC